MAHEIKSLIQAWFTVFASLNFCYFVARKVPKGKARLIALLPIISTFTLVPLNFSSFHFRGISFLMLSALANFKLILFAFNQGPLSSDPCIPLLSFISIACLPIKINHQTLKQGLKSPLNYAIKVQVLILVCYSYSYKQHMNQYLVLAIYWCNIYLAIEIIFAMSVVPARAMLGFEIEPQFEEPYLSTSVQNFWGRRWNCMVSNILRTSIYSPIRSKCAPVLGKRRALILGIMISFLVSGLMHELFYFYATRVEPTWEVTWFFIVQGAWIVLEIEMKKMSKGGWRLHPIISGFLAIGFVMVSSFWMMFPQIVRNGVDVRAVEEYGGLIEFVRNEVLKPLRLL